MVNETPQLLTKNALSRLKKIAEGNGLTPTSIELIESVEDVYAIEAHITLTPLFDVQARQYMGPIKGKGRKVLPSFAALQEEVNQQKQSFTESKDWMPDALKELKESPGYGWGHDGAKIALSAQKTILAANEKCPACRATGLMTCNQCQGKTYILCPYCFGKGEENCYNCFSTGEDPVNPQHPCPICRGTRFAPCRYCKNTGRLPCPTCQARGGTPCPACQGAGSITQEAETDSGATIQFALKGGSNLPSALLRNLDRLGMINLAKGHADIDMIEPVPVKDKPVSKNDIVTLHAKIPFAELKLRLNNRPAMVSAFGKRGLLAGVPPFLDESLRPWREHLVRAAMGHAPLEKALEARAVREALELELSGKGLLNNFRKLYPIGLSPATAKEILTNTEQALRRFTLRSRVIVSAVSLLASGGIFAGLFLTPFLSHMTQHFSSTVLLLFEALLPAVMMGAIGYAFSHAARWALQRRFPGKQIHLGQKIGKVGYGTLGGILALYAAILILAKIR